MVKTLKFIGLGAGVMVSALAFGPSARADVVNFSFSGAGTSGSGTLTVTPDTVVGDPTGAYTITNITGTFSDSNTGANISNATITGLVPINSAGSSVGAPAPAVLSYYTVTNPPPHDASISYDNLYYPNGSPITCANYPASGGFLDVYGVLFKLSNNDVVDFWSNGASSTSPLNYGVGVMGPNTTGTSADGTVLDFQSGGISAVPEPGVIWLFGASIAMLVLTLRPRKSSN